MTKLHKKGNFKVKVLGSSMRKVKLKQLNTRIA